MDLKSMAGELLTPQRRQALEKSAPELQRLAASEDGRKVRAMLDGGNLSQAVEQGDADAVRQALGKILSTQEGQRLARQLGGLLDEK